MATVEGAKPRSPGALESLLGIQIRVDAEVLAYAALIVLGILTRFWDLESRVMSHDESLHTYFSWQLFRGQGFQHTPLMHGPLQFHLLALMYFLFGDSDAAARIPVAVSGVVAIGLLWMLRPWLGRAGALLAAAMMAVSPYMLYYSRYTRNEAFVVVAALLMFWAVFRYFETRQPRWLYLFSAALGLHVLVKETSFIYSAQLLAFLGGLFALQLLTRRWSQSGRKAVFIVGLVISILGGAVGTAILFKERSEANLAAPAAGEAAEPLDPAATPLETSGTYSAGVTVGYGVALAGLLLVAVPLVMEFGRRLRTQFPAFDLLLVTGTLVAPTLAALPSSLLGWDPLDYESVNTNYRTLAVMLVLLAASVGIGLAWNWRRWLIIFGIFYVPYVVFYTTLFTNPNGLYSGLVGSLGYWLAQHDVYRGSQPSYYYALIQIPVYEFLPALASLGGLVYGLRSLRRTDSPPPAPVPAPSGGSFPAIPLFAFWAVTALAAYSFAGERMPWLTVHIALPLILLGGWALGRFAESVNWKALAEPRAWLALGLALVAILAAASALGQLFGATPPFYGSDLASLTATTAFLTTAMAAAGAVVLLGIQLRRPGLGGMGHLLGVVLVGTLFLLTARTAFRAAYPNGDQATEFLVYAHSATGVKTVMEQAEELSLRAADGLGLDIGYDDDVSWPFTWYLRNFPNHHYFGPSPTRDLLNWPLIVVGDNNWAKVEPILGDRYFSFEYIRMWWPMQEYYNLTSERILNALRTPEYRQALWDIWFDRDYRRYGELIGADYSLANWNPSDRMRLYIRKDVEALIWDYGVAPSSLEAPSTIDPYAEQSVELAASTTFGSTGAEVGQFQSPRDVAVAPDGSLYVADTFNHRIQHLSPEGEVLHAWGRFADLEVGEAPGGTFKEPWGIAVAPDGTVVVADTWNHRIQRFTADGEFLNMFGVFGQAEAPSALWGPRDVAVDPQGRIFVSDTGNKRVVAFDSDGNSLGELGGIGLELGLMDEPVGLAIAGASQLLVADTWNQRVQAFDIGGGPPFAPEREWAIQAWYGQSLENKPYLAASPNGEVCASDPEGYRILCFTATGEFVLGFGTYGQGGTQFGLPAGLAFDSDGLLWVVDSGNGRLMRFDLEAAPQGISLTGP